jgi:hypothetical protein
MSHKSPSPSSNALLSPKAKILIKKIKKKDFYKIIMKKCLPSGTSFA